MIRDTDTAVVRAWAIVDLLVCAPLAVPPLAAGVLRVLYLVNGLLGQAAVPPPFDAVHWLFVCLMGALGVAWAVARLVLPLRPLGTIDALARVFVGLLIAYFVVARAAPAVFLAFVATEFGGALHQFWTLRRPARSAKW